MTNRKKIEIILIAGVIVLVAIVSVTFAFFQAQLSGGAQTDINIGTSTTDSLTFNVDNAINLNINQTNFGVGAGNLASGATATATLLANNSTNTATYTYYVYFKIDSNQFVYTTTDSKPEIVLTITDPNDKPVTSIDGLTYVKNIQTLKSDGTTETVSGFDITTATGTFAVASAYSITANSTTPTVHDWEFTATFINLDTDQQANTGKQMDAEIIIQEEEYVPTLADTIISLYTSDGANDLYYHDGSGTYGSLEAGDYSYRYAGANPNNYICFGTDAASCPSDNLYRIIGVFGDEVKLIKADYAQTNLLGTNGDYYSSSYLGAFGSSSYYKGSLSQSSVPIYFWNVNGTNTWSESQLNIVNLNTNYLNNIGSTWSSNIATHTWQVGGNTWSNIGNTTVKNAYTNEIVSPAANTTWSGKIGLMYESDYGYAASPANWSTNMGGLNNATNRDNNWMFMGLSEWTISRRSDDSSYAFGVGDVGYVDYGYVNYSAGAVRPSFYLESDVVLTGGSGTSADPYRIA